MTTNGRASALRPTGRVFAARRPSSSMCWRCGSSARKPSFIRWPIVCAAAGWSLAPRSWPDRHFPAERDAQILAEARNRLFPRLGEFEPDGGVFGIGQTNAAAPAAELEIGARDRGAAEQRHIGIVDEAVNLAFRQLASAQRTPRDLAERGEAAIAIDQSVVECPAKGRTTNAEP